MGVVSLLKQGLIYEDTFAASPLDGRWEVLPNDSTRLELANGLKLKHGASPMFLFFEPLTAIKQFVLDIQNDYNPTEDGDVGGIAVYSDEQDYIFLEEYFNSAQGISQTYPWLRLIRDYNTYSAYWSEDGRDWKLIGIQEFDRLSPKIGLFLQGDSGEELLVNRMRVIQSTKVEVGGLVPGAVVKLKDAVGTEIQSRTCKTSESNVRFDMTHLPLPFEGILSITDGSGQTYSTSPLSIWGGDSYRFEMTLDLYFIDESGSEKLLSKYAEEFLGAVNNGAFAERQLVLRGEGSFEDVFVELEAHNGTDHFSRLVELAPDTNGSAGNYGSSVLIGDVADEARLWVKLSRENDPAKFTTDIFFGLIVYSKFIT
ncbi:hypothetical protein [Paenibacillus sp. NPDC058071]|uniref:hypothetical protein n=1 Tax=Paenibacillus sp. NPDC058071 TaxID=3346326 RepID=UPI0036DEE68D